MSCEIQPASQPPANPPTGHQMSQQWTKMPILGQIGSFLGKMTKNAYFGPILAVFGPKILIFMGVSESFGTNITENHLDNLSALFFGQALDQMGQKCRYLAQNASFGPNLAVFGPKIQFFGGREYNFWYPCVRNPMRQLFRVENIDR